MKMKKFFIIMMAGLMVTALSLTSCGQKAEVKKVGEFELTEQQGKLGLKSPDGYIILEPLYDEITENEEYDCIVATNGDETTFLVDGHEAFRGVIKNISPLGDYQLITTPDGQYLWKPGTNYCIGAFEEIGVLKKAIFLKSSDGWGGAFENHNPIAPRRFEKVYIVENGKTYAIVVKDKNGWHMYDKGGVTDGVQYDTPSKDLERELKKFDTTKPYGFLTVDWPL